MPEFLIGGRAFAAGERLSPWALMKLAKSQQLAKAGDVMAGMAGMHDFLMATVRPDERVPLDEHLTALDPDPDDLNEAIGALMRSYTDRPTGRPSRSPAGAPSTGQASRVVSLSRGTAGVEPASSPAGTPAAS